LLRCAAVKRIKPKKRCCKSGPRCKRCPVVCKRLAKQGLATRRPDGAYVVELKIGKKKLKAARAR
jgi:hypothetical protein